jgi:hypothetical protein
MSSYVMLPILSVISIVIVIKVGISKIIVSIVVVSKRVLLHLAHLKKKSDATYSKFCKLLSSPNSFGATTLLPTTGARVWFILKNF